MLTHDNQQSSHAWPDRANLGHGLQLIEVDAATRYQAKNVHDVRQANIKMPVHPLQCCNHDALFGQGDGKRVLAEVLGDPPCQEAIGEIFLFSGLSQAADVYLNHLPKAWNTKIVFTRQSISPALGLLLCGEIILENVRDDFVWCTEEKIEITSRIRPVVECLHDHDGMATLLEVV